MTTGRLAEAVALVTGASSGIGAATARALAAEGAAVALFARRLDRLDELVGGIEAEGGSAQAHAVDVTDAGAVAAAVRAVGDQFGRIDVLVHSAGFLVEAPAVEADLVDWQRMIDVNVGGVLNTTHAALPHVLRAANGVRNVADVVYVSSVAGRHVTTPESNVYAASKYAIGAFAEALRQELSSKRVRIGVIEPGLVRTEMTTGGGKYAPNASTGDPLHPEDVATAIVFMVNSRAAMP